MEHGKYSIPGKLAHAVQRAMADPDALELNLEVGVNAARIGQLLQEAEDLRSGTDGPSFEEVLDALEDAIESDDSDLIAANLKLVRDFGAAARSIEAIWKEIRSHLALAERLSNTERRWMDSKDQYMPVGLVLEICNLILRVAMRYVPDHHRRAEMAREIRSYLPNADDHD